MKKTLVIVESPAKARTIEKFLPNNYSVIASMGHIRDLKKSELSIDVEKNFEPAYSISKDKQKVVSKIKKLAKASEEVILATDEDREGEAIAWHLATALGLSLDKTKRVVFHEITKPAILHALDNPRTLDIDKVNAQQGRRILDRLVGYTLSPFLWKKVIRGLSAGRVQSVAVRLIVERERERDAFKEEEYWSIEAEFSAEKKSFQSKLQKLHNKKPVIGDTELATSIIERIKKDEFTLDTITKKKRRRKPYAPFTTSTLQQEAARKHGFTAKKTMWIAQQLYEGIDLGNGEREGLITYMRTDSLNLSTIAIKDIREKILFEYGEKYLPGKPVFYKTKAKRTEEAHEAIRPTSIKREPSSLKGILDEAQLKLYTLIYERTLSCQMTNAVFDQTTFDIIGKTKNEFLFRATGNIQVFDGFLRVYEEGKDDESDSEDKNQLLPDLKEKTLLKLGEINGNQHFTKPPARYTEATLVKALETEGIGRPSTYAPIISTIQDRGYVKSVKKQFAPEDVGYVVTDLLVEHFSDTVDIGFTAKMEKKLDEVAEGKRTWQKVVGDFYSPFSKTLKIKDAELSRKNIMEEATDEVCPNCGKPMVIKLGKFGKFLACSGYPECKTTKQIQKENSDEEADLTETTTRKEPCEKCGKPMIQKSGRYGKFWGCSGYPECKNIKPLFVSKPINVPCPKCEEGELMTKRTRRGKIFYGCSQYPKCDYATWDRPNTEE